MKLTRTTIGRMIKWLVLLTLLTLGFAYGGPGSQNASAAQINMAEGQTCPLSGHCSLPGINGTTQTNPQALTAGQSTPTLSINDVILAEDSCQNTSFVFTVTLSKLANKAVTVNYATSDGSALADKDYVPVSGTLTFTHDNLTEGPNGSHLLTVSVPLGNYVFSTGTNVSKSFTLTLSGATNASIGRAQGVGTLQNAASSCAPAAHAVCFAGQFCGASVACQQVNTSAGGTPWCQTVANGGGTFSTCIGAGLWADSDLDGLTDAAEAEGYIDNNLDGVYDPGIDVPLPGADPNKPDVYLHYDYVVGNGHDHNPPPQAIQWMVDAFAAHGVALHIDPQHNALDESVARVVTLANPADPACTGPSALSVHQLREMHPDLKLLSPAYHYMVFSHYASCSSAIDPNTGLPYCSACPNDAENPACATIVAQPSQPGNLGTAEVFGNDAIVATGGLMDAGLPTTLEAWAGLTMHELGHNLGLNHGGIDCYNQKPNYVSVMNYRFYTTGIPVAASPGDIVPKACNADSDCTSGDHPSGTQHCSEAINDLGFRQCIRIDYSDREFNSLDEAGGSGGINEELGLQGGINNSDISWYKSGAWWRAATNGSFVDFKHDGFVSTALISDVNGDGQKTPLATQIDWTQLRFSYQCQPTFAGDAASLARLQAGASPVCAANLPLSGVGP